MMIQKFRFENSQKKEKNALSGFSRQAIQSGTAR